MKSYLSISIIAFSLLLWSCNSDQSAPSGDDAVIYTEENLEDCIKKELYNDTKVDLGDYENIKVEYFNKIEDYTGKKSQEINDQLIQVTKRLAEHLEYGPDDIIGAMDDQSLFKERMKLRNSIDSMSLLLKPFRKEVIGYVFVHTFRSQNDTFRNIFIMDTECKKTEVIPVKVVEEINPDDYRKNLQN